MKEWKNERIIISNGKCPFLDQKKGEQSKFQKKVQQNVPWPNATLINCYEISPQKDALYVIEFE